MSGIFSGGYNNNSYKEDLKSLQSYKKAETSESSKKETFKEKACTTESSSDIKDAASFSKAGSKYLSSTSSKTGFSDINIRFPSLDEGAGGMYNQKAFCLPFLDTKAAKEDDLNVIVKMKEIIKNSGK